MTSIVWILVLACMVQAAPEDPGLQRYNSNSPLADRRGYVMKEITLFLTPSQIKALEANQGDKGQPYAQRYSDEEIQKLEAEIKRQLEKHHIHVNEQNEKQKPVVNFNYPPPPPVEETVNENPSDTFPDFRQNWIPIPTTQDDHKYYAPSPIQEINHQHPNTKFPESYSFVKIYTDEKVHETPKLQLFHPIPHQQHHYDDELSKLFEVRRDPLHGKQYKLIPYEYLPDYSAEAPKPEEVKELTKLVAGLDLKEVVRPTISPQIVYEDTNQDDKVQGSAFDYLKYAPNYDGQKHTDEYQKLVLKLEKDNALARAEAILKAPSAGLRKEVRRRFPGPGFPGYKHLSPYLGSEKSQVHRHVWKH